MSRNLLHRTKLEAFKEFLDAHDVPHRPGRGDYQVLQVRWSDKHWAGVYTRNSMAEHYTNDPQLNFLVRWFCRESKLNRRKEEIA